MGNTATRPYRATHLYDRVPTPSCGGPPRGAGPSEVASFNVARGHSANPLPRITNPRAQVHKDFHREGGKEVQPWVPGAGGRGNFSTAPRTLEEGCCFAKMATDDTSKGATRKEERAAQQCGKGVRRRRVGIGAHDC